MSDLVKQIESSLVNTNSLSSKITKEILDMQGMTGIKTRHFYNNLCSFKDARYFEIGVWAGSSICSAMCNNAMSCLCVDNWSEFGGPKELFLPMFNKYKGDNNAAFIEANCWDLDSVEIGKRFKFNIYLYDGTHSKSCSYKALNHFLPCLEKEFIYLIDDWNLPKVVSGTNESIKDNKLEIIYKKEIFTGAKNGVGIGYDWWNGLGIFVLNQQS